MKLGITRVRNEAEIITSTLDRLTFLDAVLVFDDCSEDNTVELCMKHPLVGEVFLNPDPWDPTPAGRKRLETDQRNYILDIAMLDFRPEWIFYFDADEHVYLDDVNWNDKCVYYFDLFDVYITEQDKNDHFLNRNWIGPEYRKIPMLFRPPARFYNRIPFSNHNNKMVRAGDVKHFGKGISEQHWEETCDYYINHLDETLKNGETIAERWTKRKGKAIHTESDFGRPLIPWDLRQKCKVLLGV